MQALSSSGSTGLIRASLPLGCPAGKAGGPVGAVSALRGDVGSEPRDRPPGCRGRSVRPPCFEAREGVARVNGVGRAG